MGYSDKTSFNANFLISETKIIKRECPDCLPSHKEVYYRRLTSVPVDWDAWENMYSCWQMPNNGLGVEMGIYSTYEDALAGKNIWTACNGDDCGYPVGFPR